MGGRGNIWLSLLTGEPVDHISLIDAPPLMLALLVLVVLPTETPAYALSWPRFVFMRLELVVDWALSLSKKGSSAFFWRVGC
jgi:hypothetical protein